MAKKQLTVGMIGYNFMGKTHSNAWRQASRFFDLPADLRMKTICGRNAEKTAAAAAQFGWERNLPRTGARSWPIRKSTSSTSPRPMTATRSIAIAAAEAGKAVLCEKPLGLNVAECERMVAAVEKAGVVNMVCHNYRRIPAIAQARRMIERGDLGERIYHYRARYAQDWIMDPEFPAGVALAGGDRGQRFPWRHRRAHHRSRPLPASAARSGKFAGRWKPLSSSARSWKATGRRSHRAGGKKDGRGHRGRRRELDRPV